MRDSAYAKPVLDAEVAAAVAAVERGRALRTVDEDDLAARSSDPVRLHHIRYDLTLAARALVLLMRALERHRDAMREAFRGPGISDEARLRAFANGEEAGLDAELCVRQIYELLYSIQVLAKRLAVPRLTKEDRIELDRLCLYRGSLLVHREHATRFTRGGRMWGRDGFDMRFGIGLQPLKEEDAAHLQALFERAAPHLTANKRAEKNWNEQLQHLYDEWPRVPAGDRQHVKDLIRRNGVKSDPPVVLARIVRKLSVHFFRTAEEPG